MLDSVQFPNNGDIFRHRYKILSTVGSGGFSRVYHAIQTDLGRPVAIKVLKPVTDAEDDEAEKRARFESVARRFEREAMLVSKLKDPNTVVMHDYGQTDTGLFFMVLEFIDGQTIADLIREEGALEPARVVKILQKCLTSLEEAHHMGILHRDIKPGNIMVYDHIGRADNVKVLDFGVAKSIDDASKDKTSSSELTADGMLVGTPRYMSPEQIRGHELTPASDLYSLGLVAFEMLVGVKAVPATSSIKIISRHLDTDPIELPSSALVPLALRRIVDRLLTKRPENRFQSCAEVSRALEGWATEGVIASTVATPEHDVTVDVGYRSNDEQLPRNNGRWIAVGVIVCILTMGLALSVLLEEPDVTGVSETVEETYTATPTVDDDSDRKNAPVEFNFEIDDVSQPALTANTEARIANPDETPGETIDETLPVPPKKTRLPKRKKTGVKPKTKAVKETAPKEVKKSTESKKSKVFSLDR